MTLNSLIFSQSISFYNIFDPTIWVLRSSLDGYASNLRRGRYPDDKHTEKLVAVLRGVADQIDA